MPRNEIAKRTAICIVNAIKNVVIVGIIVVKFIDRDPH